jgi:hypothetical protein
MQDRVTGANLLAINPKQFHPMTPQVLESFHS